ncbi:hypothetical protein [Bradyrhizobium sp.]|uniref:hypothetical protein n=1 Tax=Bradyrhizobium sp. TaxID=376 RepID=UPI001DD91BEE|nr:hypothetical protein [Bradyrhizobium sp.]MBI5320881.1 hypothetical protein [Bradyrhizobium sp.]
MHGTLKQNAKPKRKRNLSAVTSGRRLFAERISTTDSPRGRRFSDLVLRYTHDCGGDSRVSETTRNHIRRIAFLQCVLEDSEAEYVKTGVTTLDERLEYQRLSNTQSRLMKKIGLFDAKADGDDDDIPDPLEYARGGGSRRRARLDEDEEE